MNKQLNLFPDVFIRDRHAVCTSIDVAAHFGRNHKDVLKAIRNRMEDHSVAFRERNFAPVDYRDAKGESRPMYLLTRDGFMTVAMSFTGHTAAMWRELYIAEFNRMEAKIAEQERKEAEDRGIFKASCGLAGSERATLAQQAWQLIEEGCRFTETARLLGVSVHTVYRLRRRFGFMK